MINLENKQLGDSGFEQILVSGEQTIGDIESIFLTIVRSELSEDEGVVYDSFVEKNSDGEYVKLNGTGCEFGLDRMTSEEITEGIIFLEIDSMDTDRKQSVVDFCGLVADLVLKQA